MYRTVVCTFIKLFTYRSDADLGITEAFGEGGHDGQGEHHADIRWQVGYGLEERYEYDRTQS